MKVGIVPKITVGAAALIAVIFIGFIGIRQMNAPIVEERVYLSPWEEGTARPRNNLEGFPTDTAQGTENWNNPPQIAAMASTAGTEPIDGLFGEPEGTDMGQFTTDGEFNLYTVRGFTTDISVSSESTGQSAEDVMYAYLEGWRNLDFKAMGSLMTEQYRREGHEDPDDGSSINTSDEAPDEVVETSHQLEPTVLERILEGRRQASLVSSEYVGDEFHFRLITPGSVLPGTTDQGMPMFTPTSYNVMKMRKENEVWRVYDTVYDYESAMSEIPAENMRSDMGRSVHDNSEIPMKIREVQHESSGGIPAEIINTSDQFEPMLAESFREMQSRASALNSEYAGDEFHFRSRMPAPKIPDGGEQEMERSVTSPPDTAAKMRKEREARQVYEGEMLD